MQVIEGLGWPVDVSLVTYANNEAAAYNRGFSDGVVNGRYQVEEELTELREELAPEWSIKRGVWNFAVLVAQGFFRRTA